MSLSHVCLVVCDWASVKYRWDVCKELAINLEKIIDTAIPNDGLRNCYTWHGDNGHDGDDRRAEHHNMLWSQTFSCCTTNVRMYYLLQSKSLWMSLKSILCDHTFLAIKLVNIEHMWTNVSESIIYYIDTNTRKSICSYKRSCWESMSSRWMRFETGRCGLVARLVMLNVDRVFVLRILPTVLRTMIPSYWTRMRVESASLCVNKHRCSWTTSAWCIRLTGRSLVALIHACVCSYDVREVYVSFLLCK